MKTMRKRLLKLSVWTGKGLRMEAEEQFRLWKRVRATVSPRDCPTS